MPPLYPRLELCAAVLGVELVELITDELDLKPETIAYYSDSRVVLGYITNESKRFYVYVSNRVERTRKSSTPEQWHYVPTHLNPADLATRSVDAQNLKDSVWHRGPNFLHNEDAVVDSTSDTSTDPAVDDPEVRPALKVLTTQVLPNKTLGTNCFSKFSQWTFS